MLSRRRGDYPTAATYLKEALTLAETEQLLPSQANTLSNFGIVYWNMNRFDDARQYFDRAVAIDGQLGNKTGTAYTIQNLGMLFSSGGKADSALVFYNRSLAIFSNLNDQNGVASVLNNIGNLYRKQKDYPNALAYLQQANRAFSALDNTLLQTTVLSNIGSIHLDQGNLNKSRQYFTEGLEQARSLAALRDMYNGHQGLYQTFKRLRQSDSALVHYEAAVVLQDSMSSVAKNQQIMELKMTYERDKALEISRKDAEIARQNTRWALTGAVVLALLGLLVVMLLRQRLRLNEIEKKRLATEAARLQVEQENGQLLLEKQQTDLDYKNRMLASQNMHLAQKNELLNYSVRGVETMRYRLRKKLGIEGDTDLAIWMMRV